MSVFEAKARASAEAALTKVVYAKKKSEITKERARLDLQKAALEADLEALEYEGEAEAAGGEAEILEAAMGNKETQSLRSAVPSQVIQQ